MNIDIEKLNRTARDFNDCERERMADRRANRYWKCASSAIANKILRRLRLLNISISEFAAKINLEEGEAAGMLNGKMNFDLKTLIAIERAIGVHIIDQEVIPEPSTDREMIVNVEYKVTLPMEGNHPLNRGGMGDAYTTISNSIGKSKEYIIYG